MGSGQHSIFAWLLLAASCSVFGGTDDLEGDDSDAATPCTPEKSCTGCASCADYCACAKPFAIEACESSECPDGGAGGASGAGGSGNASGSGGGSAGGAGADGGGSGGSAGSGGSGGSGGLSGASCVACAQAKCKWAWDDCQSNNDCLALLNCYSPCTDQACYDLCRTLYSEGKPFFEELLQCIAVECSTECGSD